MHSRNTKPKAWPKPCDAKTCSMKLMSNLGKKSCQAPRSNEEVNKDLAGSGHDLACCLHASLFSDDLFSAHFLVLCPRTLEPEFSKHRPHSARAENQEWRTEEFDDPGQRNDGD